MTLNGYNFWEMQESAFGNWTRSIPLNNLLDTEAEITIPKFVNISLFDNTSTYGDNRADVRLGNPIVGSSRDEVTYTYINHYHIKDAYPTLVNEEGDFIILEGEGFMNTPALNCKFGDLLATSVKFFNSTKIRCGTPVITDITTDYPIAVTLNGIEYLYFEDAKTKEKRKLVFTSPITVNSINPFLAFSNVLDLEVTI